MSIYGTLYHKPRIPKQGEISLKLIKGDKKIIPVVNDDEKVPGMLHREVQKNVY